jgi:hypothetical protein
VRLPFGTWPTGAHEVGEVVEHLPHEVRAPALHEAEHREVRVPVVDLAEAAARHDVRAAAAGRRDERASAVSAARVSTGQSARTCASIDCAVSAR